jgi:hypothetical protein
MSEKLELITEVEKLFQSLLEVTSEISTNLDGVDTTEGLNSIVLGLKKRESIIRDINGAEARMKEAGEPAELEDYNKQLWLCREAAKRIQEIDERNMAVMNTALNRFMENVRSTKQSIRVVSAYSRGSMIK